MALYFVTKVFFGGLCVFSGRIRKFQRDFKGGLKIILEMQKKFQDMGLKAVKIEK